MLRILNILCLYLMVVVSMPNMSYAYFQSQGEKKDFLQAGYKVNQSTNQSTFVFYDHIHPGSIEKNKIFFPASKFFVPADLISIAFPLPIVFYSYTTTENALGDLLYANLKMKKLIEENEAIQERSKEMIWDSQYLFKQRDNTDSIYQTTQKLKESSIQTTDDVTSVLNFKTYGLSNPMSYLRPTFNRNKKLKQNFQSVFNRPNTHNIIRVPVHSDEVRDEDKHNEKENRFDKKNTSNSSKKNIDSFIIGFVKSFFNIIRYFINNKVEAVVYGVCLYFTFFFFSSILKK